MESNLLQIFESKTLEIKNIKKKPSNDQLLQLYGYYKQSTIGDCDIPQPSGFFNMKEKEKFKAWNKHKGMSKIDAMQNYITVVNSILEK